MGQIITAGRFITEDFSKDKGPNWDEEVTMYTTSSIAPVFIVHRLYHAALLSKGSKVLLVSSESGSITLRHESEGGGNYAHHASKAALNMTGKLLSLDLKGAGVIVSIVHPGFMRTEMTKGVGFDKFWDDGGGRFSSAVFVLLRWEYRKFWCDLADDEHTTAVTPDEAADSLVSWVEKLDISKTGEYWAPRGPREYLCVQKKKWRGVMADYVQGISALLSLSWAKIFQLRCICLGKVIGWWFLGIA